jgi:predicted MFS family arabinose efflux permease
MRTLLRISAFRRLMAAYVLNELAWSVGSLALSLLVYRRTGSAIGSAGFFICSQVLPALLSPPLVAKLDRRAPNRLLPVLYGIEAVLFGVLAWLVDRFSLGPVLVLVVLDGLVAITARSLTVTARVQVLGPLDLVPEGNALMNSAFAICFMAGPLLGGAVVVAGGTVAALLANCGFFAVMAVLLAGLPHTPDPGAPPPQGRLRAALAHARADRILWRLLILQGVGFACFTISTPVEVVYAQHTLHAGAGGYGALLAAWGGGAIAGSMVIARFRRRAARTLMSCSAVALGVGFVVMAVAPSLAVGLVGAVVAGLGNGVMASATLTAVQQRAEQKWLAVTMSLNQSISQLAPSIGILLGGAIASLASARAALAVGGTGSLLFAIAVMIALRPAALPASDGAAAPGDVPAAGDPPPASASGHTSVA